MRASPQTIVEAKIPTRSSAIGWMEWEEIKFILYSVGLPVLAIACLVQLLPQLLRW